ncbi:MAG: HlyC/CorC family transporter [Gammaproteobacteria bacterium]|nr:HlyC/CorC family transporter [Gammaproteobacteria bacterium]
MHELSMGALLLIIVVLTIMSAFFAGSETAMMALNRYRLRHLANEGHRGARKANHLLQRPDRLLGVILVGNNVVIFLTASFATEVAGRIVGDTAGPFIGAVVLTVYMLIFAEVTPKTVAAARPETLAFPSSYILQPLLKISHPLVIFVNWFSNLLARPLIARAPAKTEQLSVAELKTVLNEHTTLPPERQAMLVGILDLENATVEDIMVPRSAIIGIDIEDDAATIVALIESAQHTRLPVYRNHIDNIVGILHLRRAARLSGETFTKSDLLRETEEPYFVPASTQLHTQLYNFQAEKRRIALAVDEYGEIQGMATLEDLLEEIVGEFTTDFTPRLGEVPQEEDGTYTIDGSALVRDVNRALAWELPTIGPRTMNGLVLEHLESFPDGNVSVRIGPYVLETVLVAENLVRTIRASVLPAKTA